MLKSVLTIGERLAGKKDSRLYRGLLYAVGEAAANSASYGLMYVFLRSAFESTLTNSKVLWISVGLASMLILQILFSRPALENIFNAAHELIGAARIRAADHLRRLPMGFFSAQRSGELTGILTSDMALVENIWAHVFGIFAAGLMEPVFVGVGLLLLDVRLGLAMLLTLPLALIVLRITLPILGRRFGTVLARASDVNARIVEYVQGIAVLRLFGRYGDGYQRLRSSIGQLRDAQIRAEVAPSPLLSAYGFTIEVSFVIVALVGSYAMLGGTLDPQTLLMFLLISVGVSRRLFDFGVALLELRAGQKALERIEALFAERPLAEPEGETARRLDRNGSFDIVLDQVSFSYDAGPVLVDVSATLPAQKLTAIVGPSGSGKSTMMHLIARLWDVKRGNGAIRVGDIDIRNLRFEELHEHVSMVFQDVVLFFGSVFDNIRLGRAGATKAEVIAAAKAAQAHEFIAALPLGYDTPIGEGGSRLSGGERQRISLARAILKDAPIVLLDEATASVDASAEAELQRAIDELVNKKTVVVVAHRLRTVQRADQILVLERGRIVERGTHQALIEKNGLYRRLWREQERARGWKLSHAVPADT